MADPLAALERVRDLGLDGRSAWRRLAPRSVGAVTSGLVVVGASVVIRGLMRSRYGRLLGWGALIAAPVAAWILRADRRPAPEDEPRNDAGQETVDEVTGGRG